MKKTSLLTAVPAVVLSAALLSGCGLFHSQKAWEKAQQESPLEIPPGLDRPSTSAALVIPPPGAGAPAADHARAGASNGEVTDGFVVSGTVDAAYKRIGELLETAEFGQLVAHDETAHTYTVDVKGVEAPKAKRGFFARMFKRDRRNAGGAASGSNQVRVAITPSGTEGCEVRVVGAAAAVGKLVDDLRSRLGG